MEQTDIKAKEGWSWGAFAFHIPFLIGIKRYAMIWWYLLALIPLVNIVFLVAFSIYLGLNGYKLAVEGKQFSNQDEYNGYFKGMDHAGKVIVFAALVAIAALLIFLIGVCILGFMIPHVDTARNMPYSGYYYR